MRYDVYRYGYGRSIIASGPMQGCLGFPGWQFQKLNIRPVSLNRAKMMLSVLTNRREPYTPDGWVKADGWRRVIERESDALAVSA